MLDQSAPTWSRWSRFILALQLPRVAGDGGLGTRSAPPACCSRSSRRCSLDRDPRATGDRCSGRRRRGDRRRLARTVKMTAMPQMVALFNGMGGGAAALVSVAEFHAPGAAIRRRRRASRLDRLSARSARSRSPAASIAFGKLQELITGRPVTYPGQQAVNAVFFAGARRARRVVDARRSSPWLFVACSCRARSSACCSCSRSAARTCPS